MHGLNNQQIDWSDPNIDLLKTMWAAGNSHSQIAARIPNATRSAIAGKIMRLNLPARTRGHASPRSGIRIPRAAPAPRPGKVASLSRTLGNTFSEPPRRRSFETNLAEKIAVANDEHDLPPILRGEAPDGTGIQLCDLNEDNCHWPRGDPLEADFEFCGGKALKGMPYCAHHCRISYAPPQDRRREQPRV